MYKIYSNLYFILIIIKLFLLIKIKIHLSIIYILKFTELVIKEIKDKNSVNN
jgi:hypothetical protein